MLYIYTKYVRYFENVYELFVISKKFWEFYEQVGNQLLGLNNLKNDAILFV